MQRIRRCAISLRFFDGFDHYVTADIPDKWTTSGSTAISAGTGRNGTAALRVGNGAFVTKTLDSQATWIAGMAIRPATIGTAGTLCQFLDAGTQQCGLVLNVDATLSVVRSTATAVTNGTSVLALTAAAWHYVEWKVTIADSIGAGSCVVRVNGVDWITVATGQDLKATANATANAFRMSPAGTIVIDRDDVYLCDGTGSSHNDFLGDVMVTTLRPDGAGNSTQFTPSTGSNYQNVDEATSDDDTTYNSSSTAGHVDLYTLGDLAFVPTAIFGLQWNAQIRKDDASNYVFHRMIRTHATNYEGATTIAPGTSYVNYTELLEANPNTGVDWTRTEVDALEAGLKFVSVV